MNIHFSFNAMLLIVGIITAVLTIVILITEKANKKANKYLAALLLISAGTLLHNFLLETGIYNNYPSLYFLPVILSLGVGPFFYLYISSITALKEIPTAHKLLHLLPMFIQLLIYAICFLQDTGDKYSIYINIYEPLINPAQIIANYISVGIYGYLSWKKLASFSTALSAFYTDNNTMALRWLRQLLLVFMTHYILSVFFFLVAYLFKVNPLFLIPDITRCIIIFTIAFFAIKQNSLLHIQLNVQLINEPEIKPAIITIEPMVEMAGKPELTKIKEINKILLQQIIDLVEKEQLYLNEELTVSDVATKLGYSARTISFTLNNGLQKSFSRFINEYRVKLFQEKKISRQHDNLSIMGLAYDCGFNSKSTFNRMYKEITGTAPKNLTQ